MKLLLLGSVLMIALSSCKNNHSEDVEKAKHLVDTAMYTTISFRDTIINFGTINMGEKTDILFEYCPLSGADKFFDVFGWLVPNIRTEKRLGLCIYIPNGTCLPIEVLANSLDNLPENLIQLGGFGQRVSNRVLGVEPILGALFIRYVIPKAYNLLQLTGIAKPVDRPAELGGRNGPEPVRFGDWEKKGIAIDF